MERAVVIQYRTHPQDAEENRRLIEQVFVELHSERPTGLGYVAVRLADGVSFVHVAAESAAELSGFASFAEFQNRIGDRLDGSPQRTEASVVGAYGFTAEPAVSAVATAVSFIEAFGRHDMDAVSAALADDVLFESPRVRITGAVAVSAAIAEFATSVTGVDIIDALGDDDRAVVVYDMHTGPFGTLRAVDHMLLRDGRIASDTVVFDTHLVRG